MMSQAKPPQIFVENNQAKVDLSIEQSITSEQLTTCKEILEGLKNWFALEAARDQYIRNMSVQKNILAKIDGKIAGFLSYKINDIGNIAEIDVMAVSPEAQGKGIGRELVKILEKKLSQDKVHAIKVKTLSSKSSDEYYAKTRKFYEKIGFVLHSESDTEWGPENPCAIYIKNIDINLPNPNISSNILSN